MNHGLEAADFQLIKKVAARWDHALSSGSTEQFAACFSASGTLDIINGWHDSFTGSHKGHVALHKLADGFFSVVGRGGMRFWSNSPLIEGDGEAATYQAYLIVYVPNGDGVTWVGTGMLNDRLRKVGGEWLFEYRQLEIEHYPQDEWVDNAIAAFAFCGSLTPVPGLYEVPEITAEMALGTELIMQTQAKYNIYWDYMEGEKWSDLFEDDGIFHVVGGDYLYSSVSWHATRLPTIHHGTAQLREFVRNANVGRNYPRDRHWQGPAWITIDGDDAVAHVPCISQTAGTLGQLYSLMTICYFDNLRKTFGEWRFVKRTAMPEFPSALPAESRAEVAGRYVI